MLVCFLSGKNCYSQDIRLDQFSLKNPRVNVPDSLLYIKKTATLSASGVMLIKQLQEFCSTHPAYFIEVVKGHTENRKLQRLNTKRTYSIIELFRTDTNYLRNNNVIFFPIHSPIEVRKSCQHCTIFSIVTIKSE